MVWYAGGNLVYLVCQWLVTVLVTKLGGFGDAGVLSVAMSVSATFQTLAMFGMRNFQVSDIEDKYTNSCYVGFRIVTCMAAMVGCMIFSLVSSYRGEALLAIFLFMTFRLSENFADVLYGIAQKHDRLDIAGKSFAIKGIGVLAIFLAAYRISGSLNVGLAAMAIFSIVITALYDAIFVKRVSDYGFWEKGGRWISLAGETAPLCIYLFLSTAITTVPKLVLERECGGEILGAYSSIFAPALLIQAAMCYVYNPFAQIFAAHRAKRDKRGFLLLAGKITAAIVLLTVLILLAAWLLGDWALELIFGEMIRPYAFLLAPILISIAITSFFGFLCMLATVLRAFSWLLISCGAGFAFCLFLTAPMIDAFGVNGTSYSLSAGMLLASAILILGVMLRLREPRTTRSLE